MNRIVHKEYECGCHIITQSQEGFGEYLIEYCPLHKSAPKLHEALETIVSEGTRCCIGNKPVREVYDINMVDRVARQALAEGK